MGEVTCKCCNAFIRYLNEPKINTLGTYVYANNTYQVAIKKVMNNERSKQEISALKKLDHQNVIKLMKSHVINIDIRLSKILVDLVLLTDWT